MQWKQLIKLIKLKAMNEISEKPNFKRIAFALQTQESDLDFTRELYESFFKEGTSEFCRLPNKKLEELLEEYQLKTFINDFLWFAMDIKYDIIICWESANISGEKASKQYKEMLKVLEFLIDTDYKSKEIKFILIKPPNNYNSISILNDELIDEVMKAILKKFIDEEMERLLGVIEPKQFQDWGIQDWIKYVDFRIQEFSAIKRKKGRKNKYNQTGKKIDTIQRYLQEYTTLKAEKGTAISRSQASFIYRYLDLIGVFPEELSWKEDNIRHILNDYRERKAKLKPINIRLKESTKRMKEEINRLESKVKEINKNKYPPKLPL